jgi:hypothetical protein
MMYKAPTLPHPLIVHSPSPVQILLCFVQHDTLLLLLNIVSSSLFPPSPIGNQQTKFQSPQFQIQIPHPFPSTPTTITTFTTSFSLQPLFATRDGQQQVVFRQCNALLGLVQGQQFRAQHFLRRLLIGICEKWAM